MHDKTPQCEPQEPKVDDRLDGLDVVRLNQFLFKLFPVKRRRDPALPHHRLVMVKFLLLAYRSLQNDGETVSLYPLLDQLASEPGLAAAFGFWNGVPSERWLVLVHRRLVDNWAALQSVLPCDVAKPARILEMCPDRSGLIARIQKLKHYGLEPLVKRMFARNSKGPEPFDRLPVVLALLASYDRDVRVATNLTALVDELREDESLRRICGFTDLLPSRTTFIRALEVMEYDDNYPELEKIINRAINDRKVREPEFGHWCAVDSTVLRAYCNPNRKTARFRAEGCDPATCKLCRNCRGDPGRCACARSDPEASWAKKHDARAASGYIWVCGYKYHMLVDGESGDVIAAKLTTGSVGDGPVLRELFQIAETEFHWFSPELALTDRGYDSRSNVRFLGERGTDAGIPKKELGKGRFHHGIYDHHGVPTCEHGNLMQYVRTDALTESYVYVRAEECADLGDCLRRGANPQPVGYSVHGEEVWVDPKTDPWVFGYPYRHGSPEFNIVYPNRLVVERTIGGLKAPGRLSQFQYRGERRVRLHVTMCRLMKQVATMVDLDRRDEAKRITTLALAA